MQEATRRPRLSYLHAGDADTDGLLMPWMPSVAGADGASDVRVTGFGKTVQVFSSKQLPKKLEFFGDDFRSHFWIVKARTSFLPVLMPLLASQLRNLAKPSVYVRSMASASTTHLLERADACTVCALTCMYREGIRRC